MPGKKEKQYWLMKSEPDTYSIEDLRREQVTLWDGVRNYQARNFMRDRMQVGDQVLFYHSNAKPPGIVGIAAISRTGLVDPSAFDPKSPYFCEKSTKESPRWYCVEVRFKTMFSDIIDLQKLKDTPELSDMLVVQKGQRLSIQPVAPSHFNCILEMAEER